MEGAQNLPGIIKKVCFITPCGLSISAGIETRGGMRMMRVWIEGMQFVSWFRWFNLYGAKDKNTTNTMKDGKQLNMTYQG